MAKHSDFDTQWPTHAYVPGQNERHPEHAFDALTAEINHTQSLDELAQSLAFKHGMIYLDSGYFWEAHELFEPIWMVLPDDTQERRFVQGLIQLANAQLKHVMQRPKASLRLCQLARELITRTVSLKIMGVNRQSMLSRIDDLESIIKIAHYNDKL